MTSTGNSGKKPAVMQVKGPQGPPPLNPERAPQLLGKYAKFLGKEIDELVVKYTAQGVAVAVKTPPSEGNEGAWLSLAQFHELRKKAVEPSAAEKLRAFRNKYELRLNAEFPSDALKDVKDANVDASIQAFIESLDFRRRRALLMTQKQFAAAYPNGYTQA